MKEGTKWFAWMQELLSLSQAGLTYSQIQYDIERYVRLKEIAAEIAAYQSDESLEHVKGLFAQETGYQTPKIDVRGAVFHEGKVVLVRERVDNDKWTLPGGWGEQGLSPSQNAEREVLEETGLTVKAIKLAGVYDRARHATTQSPWTIYKLFFICEVLSGELTPSFETPEVKWFAEHELPLEDEISTGRVCRYMIERMFEHYRYPEMPTDFE